ncbi:hypothetical protein CsSME_00037676 [Camellia sinensis var. sinensis]
MTILVIRCVIRPKLLPRFVLCRLTCVSPEERSLVIYELLTGYDAKPIEVGLGRDTKRSL